jgi:magnesium-transporting ATPase (P-type)
VFSIRTLTQPFWKENPFSNMWLNISVVFGMFLQFVPFISPATRNFFGLEMLQMKHWALVFSLSLFMFIIIEGMKVVFGSTLKENK